MNTFVGIFWTTHSDSWDGYSHLTEITNDLKKVLTQQAGSISLNGVAFFICLDERITISSF